MHWFPWLPRPKLAISFHVPHLSSVVSDVLSLLVLLLVSAPDWLRTGLSLGLVLDLGSGLGVQC